jgi:uridylate kinase
MENVTVFSLGGSIVAPNEVDHAFVRAFVQSMTKRLEENPQWRLGVVVGGGSLARRYQASLREIDPTVSDDALDELGVAATRINAALVRGAFGGYAPDPVVLDPTSVESRKGRVIVAGGWKPGFSTDNVAVHLAESLGASAVINLSNIAQVFSGDPRSDPDARPLAQVSWADFFDIVGTEWVPGKNGPFDPAGTRKAAELHLTVIAADGRNLENLAAILDGKPYVGTTIGPD